MLLVSTAAFAAGGVGGKGDTGGKGGNGPGSAAGAGSGLTGGGGSNDSIAVGNASQNPDFAANNEVERKKKWEVGGTWETHRLIRQEDVTNASSKLFNVLGVYARYDITPNDRIGIRDYFYERFMADDGETGLRTDDVTATYTRTQPLPKEFTFAGTFALSAPTSFSSQKMSLITAPALILQLDKKIGKYIGVSARALGTAYITKYSSAEGGSPNPRYRLGGTLEAEVAMPFLEALSFGADVTTGYYWYYNVQSSTPAATGTVGDATYPNQPIQQTYGGEIFARYTLPQVIGIKSDITLAFAQGDPSLGYTSVLHDGVGHTYGFYRQSSEVYAALTLRY